MKLYQKDVFLNFAGGFRIADTGLDLSIAAAVISSYLDKPLANGIALAGEIGLSGEVRPAARTDQRIAEAERLGFKKIVVSGFGTKPPHRKHIEVIRINHIGELARHIFERRSEEFEEFED